VSKNPIDWIVPVETLAGADPQLPRVILEKRPDIYAANAIRIFRLLKERPKLISVITQQTVVETKPEESLIVLYHSIHDAEGWRFFKRDVRERDVSSVDNGHSHRPDLGRTRITYHQAAAGGQETQPDCVSSEADAARTSGFINAIVGIATHLVPV
jgi:hypothetical protein